ncbi:flagellar biosynthesis anti-sigma factor FlgM [Pseudidiomarina homiensis]|uniref:flagellar biosynthesis anti-sigma factor FlgM n=1 Tax=Pseudidiomarina homiensis TaxID=364198 RepID=UPI00215B08BD|nr:flagellar biosynthesis anti-sigma factor FlgM [Pseudidiomarina homiensis]
MKINGFQPPNNLNQVDSQRSSEQAKKATDSSAAQQQAAEVVTHFSGTAQDSSMDIDQARVDELRQAIRDGQLTMRTDQIADALLQELTESGQS